MGSSRELITGAGSSAVAAGSRQTYLMTRIRGEFLELPGLKLTSRQASRLFGVGHGECHAVLEQLVAGRFLKTMHDGSYIRAA